MPRVYEITEQEYCEIVKAEGKTQDKHISRDLRILMLRHKGFNNKDISDIFDITEMRIGQIIRKYKERGIQSFFVKKYGKNMRRNMSVKEEMGFLEGIRTRAKAGEKITVRKIREEICQKLNKNVHKANVYDMLRRNGWMQKVSGQRQEKFIIP